MVGRGTTLNEVRPLDLCPWTGPTYTPSSATRLPNTDDHGEEDLRGEVVDSKPPAERSNSERPLHSPPE